MSIKKTKNFSFYLKLKNNYYFILISIDIWNKFLKERKWKVDEEKHFYVTIITIEKLRKETIPIEKFHSIEKHFPFINNDTFWR